MENTTHESQYANAEISCTADEQLCRDAEFNLLMQAGTIVRMERSTWRSSAAFWSSWWRMVRASAPRRRLRRWAA